MTPKETQMSLEHPLHNMMDDLNTIPRSLEYLAETFSEFKGNKAISLSLVAP